jgi:hypothetical protein
MPKFLVKRAVLLFILLANCCTVRLYGDVLILKDGRVIKGDILQQSANGVLIRLGYGTFTYPMTLVKDCKKDFPKPQSSAEQKIIPEWDVVLMRLATNQWADELKQIPATVIENGIFQNVPYISFRCAFGGYEMNIYGDPDNPAAIEIGILKHLLNNKQAKSDCVAFISSLLNGEKNKAMVRALRLDEKDSITNGTFTFETTLPTEPDAYGGWWISVYDASLLEKARATGDELLTITQPRIPPPRQQTVVSVVSPVVTTNWSANDFSYSRPVATGSSPSSGRVYVRGYYRKNGTYVHSYTRSRPHHR